MNDVMQYVQRDSFIERDARSRAFALLDRGSAREILDPFDHLESPWLERQGVVPAADDGVVVALGTLDGSRTVVIAIEQAFQGGGIGEVSGAKITAALTKAASESRAGRPTAAVLLLETGGVRLQEANLGLAAVAEACAAVLELRAEQPVVAVIAGGLGSFGGMSIVGGLCSTVIMTREARLGLNGPEVIESEGGIAEFDASDRALVWSIDGGAQRHALGQADELVADDTETIRRAVASAIAAGPVDFPASRALDVLRDRLAAVDPTDPPSPAALPGRFRDAARASRPPAAPDGEPEQHRSRGHRWLAALATSAPSRIATTVLEAQGCFGGGDATLLSVVPDPTSPFHRARHGEVGLLESLALAERITSIVAAEAALPATQKRPIIAVVDLPSQAYGRLEEMVGLHLHLAAAVDAYATARAAGHPVVALVVGTALSGGFLAHGLQANQILALDDPGVEIHAMHKPAAARITRRSIEELDALALDVPPLSYDVRDWATLGLCDDLITVADADDPSDADVTVVRARLDHAVESGRDGSRSLEARWSEQQAGDRRAATRAVWAAMTEQWH